MSKRKETKRSHLGKPASQGSFAQVANDAQFQATIDDVVQCITKNNDSQAIEYVVAQAIKVTYDRGYRDGHGVGFKDSYELGYKNGRDGGYRKGLNDANKRASSQREEQIRECWHYARINGFTNESGTEFSVDRLASGYMACLIGWTESSTDNGFNSKAVDKWRSDHQLNNAGNAQVYDYRDYAQGYDRGHKDGYGEGLDDGKIDGFYSGYDDGHKDGYDKGYDDGYNRGHKDGYDESFDYSYDIGYADACRDCRESEVRS